MPASARTRLALSALAVSVAAGGLLTGCAAQAGTVSTASPDLTEEPTSAASATGTSSASASASGEASATKYTDGEYSETGPYQTPGGPEELDVTLTIEDDTVTAVAVEGSGKTANANRYQASFAGGIEAVAVGKSLDELEVGAIAGASLAPKGFNAAVEKIRAAAQA